MNIENNQESKHLQLRIARGTALVIIGGALMSRLPQLLPRQQEPSWYQSPFMIAGIIVTLIGLLILFMPPRYWKHIWQFILAFPKRLKEIFVWTLYKPEYKIDKPDFSREVLEIGGAGYEGHYRANTSIHIEAKRKPIKINLNYVKACLIQRTGWEQREVQLILETHKGIPEISLEPRGKRDLEVEVNTVHGVSKHESLPDTQKEYRWGICGIYIDLPGGIRKKLHRGIYHKPESPYRIGIL